MLKNPNSFMNVPSRRNDVGSSVTLSAANKTSPKTGYFQRPRGSGRVLKLFPVTVT